MRKRLRVERGPWMPPYWLAACQSCAWSAGGQFTYREIWPAVLEHLSEQSGHEISLERYVWRSVTEATA